MSVFRRNETSVSGRSALIQEAFRVEYVTIAWMVIEAAVAIGSAIEADSLTLLAFGIDSLIELASAGVLVWRLIVELRDGQAFAESAERRAARIGGALLFALAVYVVASAAWKLWTQQGAEFSLPGLVVSVLAVPIMYRPGVSSIWLRRSGAARCAPMRSRVSHAVGSRSSWWPPS